jgi:hypothetical protein
VRRKAGILTFHSSVNEGAILQAYCLAHHLGGNLPAFDVDIIDHRYAIKALAHRSQPDARTKALDHFINHDLPLSQKRFVSDGCRETMAYIDENYDALFVGSDEVWKLQYRTGLSRLMRRANAPNYPPFPNVYWPSDKLPVPKIAYAACIGKTEWTTIPQSHRQEMRRILDGFGLLGVRDRRTRAFLEWLHPTLGSRAEWSPDPAFAIDVLDRVDKDAFTRKLQGYGVDFSRPRLGVVVRDSRVINEAVGAWKQRGYQVVAITESNSIADVNLFDKDVSPLEWAALFGLVDACISERMHGVVFCILNNTPMIVLDFWKNARQKEGKLFDLMQSFGLMDFYFSVGDDSIEHLKEASNNLMAGEWPSDRVAETREAFRRRTSEFAESIRQLLEGS